MAVAVALTAAVVIVGLRRNLSETTRDGLPRFEGDSEGDAPTLGLYEGEGRPPGPLSARQQRWFLAFFLLWTLFYAAYAALSTDDRLENAAKAGLLLVAAAINLLISRRRQRC